MINNKWSQPDCSPCKVNFSSGTASNIQAGTQYVFHFKTDKLLPTTSYRWTTFNMAACNISGTFQHLVCHFTKQFTA